MKVYIKIKSIRKLDVTKFPIAHAAVFNARKKIENAINSDTTIQINLNFINSESAEKYM